MTSNTVARNSMWYGVETGVNLVLTLFTSIAIARSVGPSNLGYFLYVWWLISIATNLGSLGIPTATRKYIGEYFGRGEHGIVKAVFLATIRLQTLIALGITTVSVAVVLVGGNPAYRTVSLLMALSVLPCMVNAVAAQANCGLENLFANVPASLVSTGIFGTSVLLSVVFGWGLLGISVGLLTMRTAEMFVRLIPLWRRLSVFPTAELPAEIKTRMFHFSSQSLVLMALGLIVWDRSELFFLKSLCSDIQQVAFYSVAFNVTERLLVISQIFGTAVGTSVMVEFGRDDTRLASLVSDSTRYLGLIAFPIHLGLAALAGPLMLLTYGSKYAPAATALAIAAIFGIPKAFMVPVTSLFQSYGRLSELIRWGIIAGILNIALDLILIRPYGAIGAAFANGITQTFSAGVLWFVASRQFHLRLPLGFLLRVLMAAGAMAGIVALSTHRLPFPQAIVLGIAVGTVSYFALLRFMKLLDSQDQRRLAQLRHQVPGPLQRWFDSGLAVLIPAAAEGK